MNIFSIRPKSKSGRWVALLLPALLVMGTLRAEPHRIDLLVVYTPAVKEYYHGENGVLAHVLATLEGTNAIYENSDIPIVLNLAHVAEVDYVEGDTILDDLERLKTPGDGYLEEVHGLRDEYGADLVCLFRRGSVGGVAGRAYQINPNNASEELGFSVVADNTAMSNFTFVHEMGHNLGSVHDRSDLSTGEPDLPFSWGYRFVGSTNSYRTVMAVGFSYTRIPYFSNPEIVFDGQPLGVPIGEDEEADNATALSIAGPVLAEFRPEQTLLPAVLYESPGATLVLGTDAEIRPLVTGFPPLDYQWYRGFSGDTSEPVAGATDNTLTLSAVAESQNYWLQVSNADGTVSSLTIPVVAVGQPSGPLDVTVVEDGETSGFAIENRSYSQTFTFPGGYIDRLSVKLFKQGNPPAPTIELATMNGRILFSDVIDPEEVAGWITTLQFPVRAFVTPGEILRVRLHPSGGEDDDNRVAWLGVDNPEVTDPNMGAADVSGFPNWVFAISVEGRDSWTYHAWLSAEGIPTQKALPTVDLNNDGVPNHLRYALGLSPDDPLDVGIPFAGAVENGPGGPEFIYQFNERSEMADLTLIPQMSTDLVEWASVPMDSIHLESLNGDVQKYEIRLPINDAERLFLRLKTQVGPLDD